MFFGRGNLWEFRTYWKWTDWNSLKFSETYVTKKLMSQELKHPSSNCKKHWKAYLYCTITLPSANYKQSFFISCQSESSLFPVRFLLTFFYNTSYGSRWSLCLMAVFDWPWGLGTSCNEFKHLFQERILHPKKILCAILRQALAKKIRSKVKIKDLKIIVLNFFKKKIKPRYICWGLHIHILLNWVQTLSGMVRIPQKKFLCAISSTWIDENY